VSVESVCITIGSARGGGVDLIGGRRAGGTKDAAIDAEIALQRGDVVALAQRQRNVHLTFNCQLADNVAVSWQTLLVDRRKLYISIQDKFLPSGSRESLVSLLDYAESTLKCSDIVVCLRNDRPDRPAVMRLFMYLGFALLDPGSPLIPVSSGDVAYMAYHIEADEEDDDDDDD
jgi:ornithine decarboxylase antizyme 1